MKLTPQQKQQHQVDTEQPKSMPSPVITRNPPVLFRQPSNEAAPQRLGRKVQQLLPYPHDKEPDEQVKYAMPYPAGSLEVHMPAEPTSSSPTAALPPVPEEPTVPPPPPPPFFDPWSHHRRESYAKERHMSSSSSPQPAANNNFYHRASSSAASFSLQPARDSVASSANMSMRSFVSDYHPLGNQHHESSSSSGVSPVSPTAHLGMPSGGSSPFDFPQGLSPHVAPLFSRVG